MLKKELASNSATSLDRLRMLSPDLTIPLQFIQNIDCHTSLRDAAENADDCDKIAIFHIFVMHRPKAETYL